MSEKRYVPKRNKNEKTLDKIIKEKIEKIKREEKNIKEQVGIKGKEEREESLKKIKKRIDEINNNAKKDKEKIKLAQFTRFYKFVEKENFEIKGNKKVEEFIERQVNREISKEFYLYIKKELLETDKGHSKEYNKTVMDTIEQYLKYQFGEERIEDKLKENNKKN